MFAMDMQVYQFLEFKINAPGEEILGFVYSINGGQNDTKIVSHAKIRWVEFSTDGSQLVVRG
jgi:hypothetical protein